MKLVCRCFWIDINLRKEKTDFYVQRNWIVEFYHHVQKYYYKKLDVHILLQGGGCPQQLTDNQHYDNWNVVGKRLLVVVTAYCGLRGRVLHH